MMKESVLQKHDHSKRKMKSGVPNLLEELDFILKLSIGTPYYQERLGSTSVDMVVCSREPTKAMRIKPTTKNSLLEKILVYPECPVQCPDTVIRSIRTVARSIRVTVTHLKVSLGPESPNLYVQSIRTYTRSIRVPFSQWLVFVRGGINTPHTPSFTPLLPISKQNQPSSKRELSHFPSSILE
jgi:hypothetical protein